MKRALLALMILAAPLHAEVVVALGDSITRGVRDGVGPDQTFAAVLQTLLKAKKFDAEVVNVGVGGERTDQALKRLDGDVIARKPKIVIVMYGHNDSHFDTGKSEPRLPIADFEKNLSAIVGQLRKAGIEPILMTPPRGGEGWKNGNGVNPNAKLGEYSQAIRKVAADTKSPLVDHYAHWLKREKEGVKLAEWTTDQYHANARGHIEMAELMLPVVAELLAKPPR